MSWISRYFRNVPIPFLYIFLAALTISVISATSNYALTNAYPGLDPKLALVRIVSPFYNYMLWAFLTPIVFWNLMRFSLENSTVRLFLITHLPLSILVAVGHELFSTSLFNMSTMVVPALIGCDVAMTPLGLVFGGLVRFFEYWLIAVVFMAISYYKKYKDNQYQLSQMQSKLATSQLKALRMQLHPHFLFNTLNTVSALMERNVEEAQKVVTNLGDLLRKFLDRNQKHLIPLSEELEYLRNYLEIEKMRFADRLKVNYEIPQETRSIMVPNLLLQPLAENVIKHGLNSDKDEIIIKIKSKISGQQLELSVQDDGKGIEDIEQVMARPGVGLNNLKSRLNVLYKNQYKFELDSKIDQGTKVTIHIPLKIHENGFAKN